jgi:hypothetical protein
MTGAMPSSVCLRSGFTVATSFAGSAGAVGGSGGGSALGAVRGVLDAVAAGGSERAAVTGAMPSRVCLRSGLATGAVAATGAADGRGAGVDEARGTAAAAGTEARGAGVDEARGAGVDVDEARGAAAAAGTDARGSGAGVDVEGLNCGTFAGAGISSAPHSESISSVGGAMDGRGGLALTRSLSDRLSFIALSSAFHGPAHKSSAHGGVR